MQLIQTKGFANNFLKKCEAFCILDALINYEKQQVKYRTSPTNKGR